MGSVTRDTERTSNAATGGLAWAVILAVDDEPRSVRSGRDRSGRDRPDSDESGEKAHSGSKAADGPARRWEVPAQYRSKEDGSSSPLEKTLRRATQTVPRERIYVVVAAEHREWWRRSLWVLPASNVIAQPLGRAAEHGITLSLKKIHERDPAARVVLLQATRRVAGEETSTQAHGRELGPDGANTGESAHSRSIEAGGMVADSI